MEIYETIEYIFDHSNQAIIASWHMDETKVPLFETEDYEGGLEIYVDTDLFKGTLQITLSWLDLFDITLLDDEGSVQHQVCNIYVDALVPTINELIARPLVI